MLTKRRPCSFAHMLQDRQLGGKRNQVRKDLNLLRLLILEGKTVFRKVWQTSSKSPVFYEGNRFYCDNYRTCYAGTGVMGSPRLLYQLQSCPNYRKNEDALICNSTPEIFPLSYNGHKGSIITVSTDSWLRRSDLQTGKVYEEIYLSPKHKFREFGWVSDQERFYVKSTRTKTMAVHREAGIPIFVVKVLAVFDVYPLTFVGMMEVDRRIFGKDVTDVVMSQGLFITLHQSGHVRLYSWEDIVRKFRHSNVKLNELVPDSDVICGKHPTGLPFNIKVTERPPALFEVQCSEQNVQIGGFPWHYIITPHRCHGWFEVRSVLNNNLAVNGELDNETQSIEPDRTVFHGDDSGHILHISKNNVRKLKLVNGGDATRSNLEEIFCITDEQVINVPTPFQITSSGRCIKKRSNIDELVDVSPTTVQDVAYEDDLDLLLISYVTCGSDSTKAYVCLYHNDTGKLLHKITLEVPSHEFFEHRVVLDVDTLVQTVKISSGKFICTVYKLFGEIHSEETMLNHRSTASKQKRVRNTRRRMNVT